MPDIRILTVRMAANGKTMIFRGRLAWALHELIHAGALGCTPITHPGPRWSGYVHDLRRAGLAIETVTEKHAGPYPGAHARYVLRTAVEIVDLQRREVAA